MATAEKIMTASIGTDKDTGRYCIQIIGDTYPHREELKAADYTWNKRYGRWQFDFEGTPTAEMAQDALDRLQPLAGFFPAQGLQVFPR